MTEYVLRLTNGTDTAPRVRQADALPLFPTTALKVRSGVRNDGGGVATVVAGTMGVSVSAFVAFVQGGSSTTQGGYTYVLDAAKTLTLSDGHASLVRVDTIAVVVKETAFDGSGSTSASLQVVAGIPGAGAPALPASAVAIRDVSVPAGASAGTGGLSSGNLSTDRRFYLPTGIMRVGSATERGALTVHTGLTIYRTDTKAIEVHNGTAWDTYVPQSQLDLLLGEHGQVTMTATGGTVRQAVTYAQNYSAVGVPRAMVSLGEAVGIASVVNLAVESETATGFTIAFNGTDDGAARTINWSCRP